MADNVSERVTTVDDICKEERYPIFPLPVFILSGGRQKLRIFEARYLSMVAHSQETNGFVISPCTENKEPVRPKWGAHVQIVDFDSGSDGILTIDVLAGKLVTLESVSTKEGGLITATAKTLQHWSHDQSSKCSHKTATAIENDLADLLKQLCDAHNELNSLYRESYFSNPKWVCARLLEILPISMIEKEKFVFQLTFPQLLDFLGSLLKKEIK